jgi:tetratricopeptide (TPR) repeat protein
MKKLNLVLAVGAIVIAGFTPSFGQNISDEARRHFDRGAAAVEMAKSPEDYEVAINEFKQAINLAPDWADAYFNLGKVQEQAEKFGEAIASLREYLRLAPNASDADEIKSLINKLEFKAENTLTPADISTVFASLSKWEIKGNCTDTQYAFRHLTLAGEGLIKVLLYSDWEGESEPRKTFQTVKVEGTTVRYKWAKILCQPPGCQSIFGNTLEEEIEVVSKTRVKVRQVVVWAGEVTTFGQLGKRYECELLPPR